MDALDSSQFTFGAICAGLALVAYVGYKIVKKTIVLALAAFLAFAAAGGVGAFYIFK